MKTNPTKGQIILLMLVFVGVFMTVTTAFVSYLTAYARAGRIAVASAQAESLAESGLDKATDKLNQNASYAGESDTALGNGVLSITVTNIDSQTKEITAVAAVPNATNPVATETVKGTVSVNANIVSFRYGVQAGAGGFTLTGGATINGNVYANGSINATTGVHITGSATAADPPAVTADQKNDTPTPIASCTSSTCITFGDTSGTQDFAQSFRISSAIALDHVELYLKKVGSPGDETVRIVTDNAGVPGSTTLLSGTLSSSLVTTSFGWVSVPLPATPVLDPSQTYWLVIDGSSNSSKYYVIGANSAYASGTAKIGKYSGTWANTSPSGLDGYFRVYLGGGTSMIGGNTYATGVYVGTTGSDTAWAHTVMGATVSGPLYCQTSSYTNKSCVTSQGDPSPQSLPVSDGNITDWKNDAIAGGVISGNYTVGYAGAALGPKEITGNLVVNGGGTLDITGTLYVQGSLTVTGGGKVKLDASYGGNDGVIVVDGTVAVNGGATFAGSGTTGSYPFLITTSACPAAGSCAGADAVTLSGGAGTVAIVAQNGTASISGGSALKAVTAKEIDMSSGATLTYDSGLVNANFSSGPGGSWEFVPGTYAAGP